MGIEVRELDEAETRLAYEAMRELRPAIGGEEQFVDVVSGLRRSLGYRLVASFEMGGSPEAAAVAGFRVGRSFSWGTHLYVDDLVTLERFRRRGHARELVDWLFEEARRLGCDQVHLDSGTHRHEAHRLYLQSGFTITSFHFTAVM